MSNFPPLPVQPLNYLPPRRDGRPGIVTAIGITSIAVAAISGLVSLIMGAEAGGFYLMAKRMRAMPAPPVMVTTAPVGVVQDSVDGMDPQERQMVVAVLARLHPEMSAKRREHLDALLARTGRTIFAMRGPALTTPAIRASVSRDGRIPSARGDEDGHYFVTPNGRIEIYDEQAMFDPGFGKQRVSSSANAAAPTTAAVTGVPVRVVNINITWAAVAAAIGESIASIGLAIFLLVSGILVLMNSTRGAKLHRIYAYLKIPLAMFSAWSMWVLWSQFFNSVMATVPGPRPMPAMMNVVTGAGSLIGAAISCVYPIALLIVLRTRTVRSYYEPVRY